MSFQSLLNHFYETTGIEFQENKNIVDQKIKAFYEEKGYNDYHDFFFAIKTDPYLHQDLINLLTTSETYFYRELPQIELFIAQVKEKRHSIKVLCAPCASGEEPFSLLIAMLEAKININDIEIYGIDINTNEIDKAKSGIFTHRRLHQLPKGLENKYFIKIDESHYQIIPELQRHVHFRQMNLFDRFPSELDNFDVIFSRNMLIYFDKKSQEKSEKIFYERLRSGGSLFLGHADHIHGVSDFKKLTDRGVSYYQK
ncbi:CheR family methyltransferase [Campylobacterota bacterium]